MDLVIRFYYFFDFSTPKTQLEAKKTRRQILILGGLAGSGFVLASLTKYLWDYTSAENTSSSYQETPLEDVSTSKATT